MLQSLTWTNAQISTKPRSYADGRRLYTLSNNHETYWLKFHHPQQDGDRYHSFKREIEFYRSASTALQHILLPFQMIALNQKIGTETIVGDGLQLIDSESMFNCRANELSRDRLYQYLLQVLDVIQILHQQGWIHGDLKPEHFRKFQQRICLIDFEQSVLINYPEQQINATPHYMAPELFHGQCKSTQSDLYALGIILYEWLQGEKLQAKTYHEWAILHCQKLLLDLPPQFLWLDSFLSGLLQKKIDRRLPNVERAKIALKHCFLV